MSGREQNNRGRLPVVVVAGASISCVVIAAAMTFAVRSTGGGESQTVTNGLGEPVEVTKLDAPVQRVGGVTVPPILPDLVVPPPASSGGGGGGAGGGGGGGGSTGGGFRPA